MLKGEALSQWCGDAVALMRGGFLQNRLGAQLSIQKLLIGLQCTRYFVGSLPHELDAKTADAELEQLWHEWRRALRLSVEHGVAATHVHHDGMLVARIVAEGDAVFFTRTPARLV